MFWGALQLSSTLATLFFYKLTKSPFAHGPPHSGSSHPRTTLTQNGSLRVLFFCPFLPASVGRGPGTTTPSRDCFLRLLLLTLLLFASSLLPSPPTLQQPPCAPGPLPPPRRAFRAQLKSHVSHKDFGPLQVPSRELSPLDFLGRMGAV